jgi:uncharacterized membrane protein YqjE
MSESIMSSLDPRDGQSSVQQHGLAEPRNPEMSLGELFSLMTSDLSTLFRKELQLVKIEAKDEVAQAGRASALMVGAAAVAMTALTMLSFALAWWIDQALNTAVSFLIVGVIWIVVAAAMVSTGRKRLKDIKVLPETKQTIKEDVEWAKTQKT